MRPRPGLFCSLIAAAFLFVVAELHAAPPAIDFNRDIRPILFGKCVTCHGPDENERAAGLRLDTVDGAREDLGGYAAIVPGDAEASELIVRITSDDDDLRMPPSDHTTALEPKEIELLKRWIDLGGDYAKHWSYEAPVRPPLPTVSDPTWPQTAVDYFTLAEMHRAGVAPSPQADRLTIARRVALDLTGLPPTWEQAQAYANDPRENAYEVYVDSLLANPAFGERWARVWLDLARYADSAGYADDPPRTIWAYRDYVIDAINRNMPFDQFTIEQIAGDLLPNPTEQQLVATAFHRNTLTNNEGGTNDEEFRNVAVVDRVNTTMAVWMGTTMACAQCHTHKYDPITQEEYFRFFAFFNSTSDADRRDEQPLLELWSDAQLERKQSLSRRIGELKIQIEAPSELVDRQKSQWLSGFTRRPDWHVAPIDTIESEREFSRDDEGWVRFAGAMPENDRYKVSIPTSAEPITGIRIEVPESQTNNFVISQIRATWSPKNPMPVPARYVRVDLPGKNRHLHLAEIEVFSDGKNIALEGTASQSSTYADAVAGRVNDGNTDGDYQKGSVQHTSGQRDPWVEIDLGDDRPIDQLIVWNRTDGGKSIVERLNGYSVSLLDATRQVVWSQSPDGPAEAKQVADLSGTRQLPFSHASADFEQQGFPAASVITAKPDPKKGWAVAPQTGQPHELQLTLQTATPAAAGTLTLFIDHQSVHRNHLLNQFRPSLTSAVELSRWADLPASIRQIVAKDSSQRGEEDIREIDRYFRKIAPALKPLHKERDRLQSELETMKPHTTVPVMRELSEDKRRETKIQLRGNYQSTGATVSEGTPAVFHPIDHSEAPNRLDLANWLIDARNPLTARVIVNRHWEQLFGIGIVETSEEFGSQGALPSHPELLDWLAIEFRESGWDVKRLLKTIVLSATYRQSSATTPDEVSADPANRNLSRGPRFRVSAEMVRDQALFVAGLLSEKRFGPPVKPPQPELGLKAAFGSATDWQTSRGEDRYRRGLYTTWRRSSPYPSMAQFDAPNREVCTVRRIRTNTPLQALVTLNDPVYVEAAQGLARKTLRANSTTEDRIGFLFNECLLRRPKPGEIERISQLVLDAASAYRDAPDAAAQIATDPIGELPHGADPVEYATWTVVANVILNLDEFLMKR